MKKQIHAALEPFYLNYKFKLMKSQGVFKRNGFEVFWGESSSYIDAVYFLPTLKLSKVFC